ncbi:MAG TPA: AzlC family ABC transporter permease [Actinomycetota bacterium]|nr:AzlC family ABC transporter permease [Actinomycetota bacterium]
MALPPGYLRADGVITAFALAVIVFGATFGVLARAAGLTAPEAIFMSVLVFAGASQFAVIGAISAGAGTWVALVAGALLNLRLFALALAVAPGLSKNGWARAVQSYLVTDETAAVAARPDGSVDEKRFVTAGVWVAGAWIVGTTIGALGGSAVSDPLVWGLDAAFPGGFLALLAPRLLKDRVARKVALVGAVTCLALTPFVPLGIAPLVAALAAFLAVKK